MSAYDYYTHVLPPACKYISWPRLTNMIHFFENGRESVVRTFSQYTLASNTQENKIYRTCHWQLLSEHMVINKKPEPLTCPVILHYLQSSTTLKNSCAFVILVIFHSWSPFYNVWSKFYIFHILTSSCFFLFAFCVLLRVSFC